MSSLDDLHLRQCCLPEIGEAGQRALAAARVTLAPGAGAGVALEYLARAGVGAVMVARGPGGEAPSFPHAPSFHHAQTHALALGCWTALTKLRATLDLPRGEE